MKPFLVKIEMSAPVILGRRLTLDALLAAQIYERTQSIDRAHTEVPLARLGMVWSGSQAFIDASAPSRQVSIVASLRADLDITPQMIRPNNGRKALPGIDSARGPYRNQLSVYRASDAPSVWFAGRGDVEAVEDLIGDLPSIGTKRTHGYGQVSRVHIRALDNDLPNCGLLLADGSPARPIPVADWQSISSKSALISAERFKPPYWDGDPVLCAVPSASAPIITQQFFV